MRTLSLSDNVSVKAIFTPPGQSESVPFTKVVTTLVTDMGYWYGETYANPDVTSFDTSNVTNFSQMFFDSAFNRDINHWDVSKGTNFYEMFKGTNVPFNQPLNNWDVGSATDIRNMFLYTTQFNQNLSAWQFDSLSNLQYGLLHEFYGGNITNAKLPDQLKQFWPY
jgi:hypothetical protein